MASSHSRRAYARCAPAAKTLRLEAASMEVPTGLEEFLIEGRKPEPGSSGTRFGGDLTSHMQSLVDESTGQGLAKGQVPMTTFWLLDDASRVVGLCRLRHQLTDVLLHHGGHIGYYVRPSERGKGHGRELLRLALLEARKLGIEKALLTTNSDNQRSIRVIESNNGQLEDERIDAETGAPFRRYWIDLTRYAH